MVNIGLVEKGFSHCEHKCSFIKLCSRWRCSFKSLLDICFFSQMAQIKMSSAEQSNLWSIARWSRSFVLAVKIRSQKVHMWNIWWLFKCALKATELGKLLPHLSQTKLFESLLWTLAIWFFIINAVKNPFPHTWHTWGKILSWTCCLCLKTNLAAFAL